MSSNHSVKQPALLRLAIKLTPAANNLAELQKWPDSSLTPDFAVATSGAIQLEMDGQLVGTRANQIGILSVNQISSDFNGWLPDYVGGFVLNLGRAAQKLREGATQVRAAFVDEPLALRFQRQPDNKVRVAFEADGKTIRAVEVTEAVVYDEIRRVLHDFRARLLALNPNLAKQRDVVELTGYLEKL